MGTEQDVTNLTWQTGLDVGSYFRLGYNGAQTRQGEAPQPHVLPRLWEGGKGRQQAQSIERGKAGGYAIGCHQVGQHEGGGDFYTRPTKYMIAMLALPEMKIMATTPNKGELVC